jgi:hypothetical protein
MLYIGYIAFILLMFVVVIAPRMDINALSRALSQSSLALIACVMLTHVPGLLPIATLQRFHRAGPLQAIRIEILTPILIWTVWVLIGFAAHQTWRGVFIGGLIAAGVGGGYASVWLSVKWAGLQLRHAAPHPNPEIAPLRAITMRYCYVHRVIGVAMSLVAAFLIAFGIFDLSGWMAACVVLSGAAAMALAGIAMGTFANQAKDAQSTAAAALTTLENTTFACDVMLYCSDRTTAKHTRIKSINSGLKSERLRTVIVAREPAAVARLKKFGADRVWNIPYVNGLDAAARPDLRAVFYSHDGLKNGHFTRFQQFAHILDAKTGALSRAETLNPALSMYDYIIAPSVETAIKWRASLPDDDAQKVLSLDLNPLMQMPIAASLAPSCDIALCLSVPRTSKDTIAPEVMLKVAALVDRFKQAGQHLRQTSSNVDPDADVPQAPDFSEASNLYISVPAGKTVPLTLWHRSVLAMGKDERLPLIQTRRETAATTWHRADIVIATTVDQFAKLRMTGKPILWLGEGPAPEGAGNFDTKSDKPLHEIALRPDPDPLHFTSYRALLDHVDVARGPHVGAAQ